MGWVGRLEGVDMCARVSRENARTVVVVVVAVLTVVDQLVDAWSELSELSHGHPEHPPLGAHLLPLPDIAMLEC